MLSKRVSGQEYKELASGPKSFNVKLTTMYQGEEGTITRTWSLNLLAHAAHSNWNQVGQTVIVTKGPEFFELLDFWPVRREGFGVYRHSWAFPAVTLGQEAVSSNEMLKFLENPVKFPKFVTLAVSAGLDSAAKAEKVERQKRSVYDSMGEQVSLLAWSEHKYVESSTQPQQHDAAESGDVRNDERMTSVQV
jgi:hypothetical protein